MPLTLAVVVPVLNESARLAPLCARLSSAADGLDRADQWIVVDGGSEDDSRAVASAAGARVLEAPRGRGAQLAAGAAHANCDLLLFLHADAWPEPGTLAALRRAFEQDPDLCAAGCAQRVRQQGWFYRSLERWANRRVQRGIIFGDSGLCLRREFYLAAGGYHPLPILEDVELSQRLRTLARQRAQRIELIPEARISISARRWEREGRLRATLRNRLLLSLYSLGVDPARLARWYTAEPVQPALDQPRRTT